MTLRPESPLKLALVGYGHVGRALAALLRCRRREIPFLITGIHTRHGTAIDSRGLDAEPVLGPPAASIDAFLTPPARRWRWS